MNSEPLKLSLKVTNLATNLQAFTGHCFVSPNPYHQFLTANKDEKPVLISIQSGVFTLEADPDLGEGNIRLGMLQRKFLKVSIIDSVEVSLFVPNKDVNFGLSQLVIEASLPKSKQSLEIQCTDLEQHVRNIYAGIYLTEDQILAIDHKGTIILLTVIKCEINDMNTKNISSQKPLGTITDATFIKFQAEKLSNIKLLS
jgi:hypothetical protein